MNESQNKGSLPFNQTKNNQLSISKIILFVTTNLLILAFILFSLFFKNTNSVNLLNFPVNSLGQTCLLKYSETYPYLYIDLSANLIKYHCVNECPSTLNLYTIRDSSNRQIIGSQSNQVVNIQLGGICWSRSKQSLMKNRGLNLQLQEKYFLLNKFHSVIYLCLISFGLGTLCVIGFYCFPTNIVYFVSILLSFILLGIFLFFIIDSKSLLYRTQMLVLVGLAIAFLIINLLLYRDKLFQSIRYSSNLLHKFTVASQSRESPILKFVKCFRAALAFSLLHILILFLILYEYVGIVSNEPLTKNTNQIYYNIDRTWWKYILLVLQWLFLSNLFQSFYQYIIVKVGYHINTQSLISCPSFSFSDILTIYHYAFLQTVLWIPLKFSLFFKPPGAIIHKNQEQTWGQKFTKLCFCCCGIAINYLHKMSFNPFLVISLQPSFDDLDTALTIIQRIYHRRDAQFDKTSLWLFRLFNYVNIGIISILLLNYILANLGSYATSILSNIFIIFAMIVAVEICQYHLTMWSLLTEISKKQNQISNLS